jgi:hypothetical protein
MAFFDLVDIALGGHADVILRQRYPQGFKDIIDVIGDGMCA